MITIVVSGGIVQDVYSDLEDQFILVNYDDHLGGEAWVTRQHTWPTNQIYPELARDIKENLPDA